MRASGECCCRMAAKIRAQRGVAAWLRHQALTCRCRSSLANSVDPFSASVKVLSSNAQIWILSN